MVREAEVTNAVRFLNDTRVKAAPATRAAQFLKRKGLTKDEIEEAFRRAGREAPPPGWENESAASAPEPSKEPTASSGVPSQMIVLPKGARIVMPEEATASDESAQMSRSRKTWNALVHIAAGAGVLMMIRELLKKYVVPLYFPEVEAVQRVSHSRGGMEGVKAEVRELRMRREETEKRFSDSLSEITEKLTVLENRFNENNRLVQAQSSLPQPVIPASPIPVVFRPSTTTRVISDSGKGIDEVENSQDLNLRKSPFSATTGTTASRPLPLDDTDDDFMRIAPASVGSWKTQETPSSVPETSALPIPPGTLDSTTLDSTTLDSRRKSFQETMMAEARAVLKPHSPQKKGTSSSQDGLLNALESPKP
uniref:Peroxisomal membrane protein PEX14 n=1 Tax=Compsopogon caeruleus TaxID=31354 RepID=A0A7S1T5W1_9RHOD|mmetsp:Transcript_10583/g.21305  ORF Transcript_10583/g.21305 Transcript_10583/m.21305 type:complete len:366 (+) Transcript_10583:40-1137(+)